MNKKIIPISLIVSLISVSIVFSEDNNFIYDNANIISNSESLNQLIVDMYNYKENHAKIVVYTDTDEEVAKEKISKGMSEFNLEDNSLNVLIVYSPGWPNPYIIVNKNCGLDVNEIRDMLKSDNEDILNDIPESFNQKDYDRGLSDIVINLINMIELKIDIEPTLQCAIEDLNQRNEVLYASFQKTLEDEKIGLKEIPITDLNRINKYDSYIKEAHKLYPAVPVNMIRSLIEKESNGISTNVNQNSGAAGLIQITALTGTDPYVKPRLIGKIMCAKCSIDHPNCSPTSQYCLRSAAIPRPSNLKSTDREYSKYYDYRLDPRKNILGGTSYFNYLLNRCDNINSYSNRVAKRALTLIKDGKKSIIPSIGQITRITVDSISLYVEILRVNSPIDDTERIKCALSSYNAGPTTVEIAVAKADSLLWNNYNSKLPRQETRDYITITLSYYKWLEKYYPETA